MAVMAGESSFDIVSKVDRQEVDNALNMAAKEVRNRFDFKGTGAEIRWSGEAIEMEASGEERVKAILDVFQTMLVRRKVDLKSLEAGSYNLVVEAAREVGGRELLKLPLLWPPADAVQSSVEGGSELGRITLDITP